MGYKLCSFFCLIGFLVSNSASYGQEDLIRTTLWQIVKPGSRDTSYLFGTNSLCMDTYLLENNLILRKLESSQYYITEQNYLLYPIANYWLDPDSIRWHRYASRSQKNRFKKFFYYDPYFRNCDIVHTNIYKLKQWVENKVGATNSGIVSKSRGSFNMDYDLQLRWKKSHRIVALESQRDYHSYFMLNATMGFPLTIEVVKRTVREVDSLMIVYFNEEFRTVPNDKDSLFDKYLGVVDNYYNSVIHYNFSGESQHPFDSILLESRNKNWLPKIIQYINKSRCFISVNLDNLKYRYGLIQLLKAEGYIVEPILLEELKK